MKKFYESPEADVVVLFPKERIAVVPYSDDEGAGGLPSEGSVIETPERG